MTESEKNTLRELLLNAIDAHKQLEAAKANLENARARFGRSKLYSNEPRHIAVDGKLWSVTVPFPADRGYNENEEIGSIEIKELGDFV